MLGILRLILIQLVLYHCTSATPIDNGVEGDPEIECAADSITVSFNVRNEFQGHVYVKGRYAEGGECRTDGGGGGRKVASIKLAFTACGTKRERSLNPKGVTVQNTVVITFHPNFLTKVDRAYTVQCFYMEADKTVSQELEVSEITTGLATAVAPMPVCRYEILDGSPTGQPVKFAEIGQQVYHKWTCETETVDMFCALVHSCYVDDGAGNNAQLLNDQGCSLDKHLLGNLEYQTDLMAGHEAHVFKYADKPALFFQCQISILGKEPGEPCNRPQCPEPGAAGGAGDHAPVSPGPSGTARGTTPGPSRATSPLSPAPNAASSLVASRRDSALPTDRRKVAGPSGRVFRFRYARDAEQSKMEGQGGKQNTVILADAIGTMDVAAQGINTLEIDTDDNTLSSMLRRHHNSTNVLRHAIRYDDPNGICLQMVPFTIMVSLTFALFLTGTMVIFRIRLNRPNKQ